MIRRVTSYNPTNHQQASAISHNAPPPGKRLKLMLFSKPGCRNSELKQQRASLGNIYLMGTFSHLLTIGGGASLFRKSHIGRLHVSVSEEQKRKSANVSLRPLVAKDVTAVTVAMADWTCGAEGQS